jgi:hypothetical protein
MFTTVNQGVAGSSHLINTALFLYEKENIDEKEKGGHQKGEKHGDVARDREKNDRPAQ